MDRERVKTSTDDITSKLKDLPLKDPVTRLKNTCRDSGDDAQHQITTGQPATHEDTPRVLVDGKSCSTQPSPLALLMARTGYSIVQQNGQRRYGPPPDWKGIPPKRGCEVFVGKIPRDCFEDELVPVFEKVGKIYELRLMMDYTGQNRGYAFVVYCSSADAKESVKVLNNYEIRQGRTLGVCMSVDNCRLFIGGIPKRVSKEDIRTEMDKVTEGVVDVIVYPSASDKTKNRGFAFVEYESHRSAAMARRRFMNGRVQLWNHQIAIDWAEPELEVDENIMAQVRVLYVRNLMLTTTEQLITETFSRYATIERVKKIRDYAFVHFQSREGAIKAMKALNGTVFDGAKIEVTLAKPVDKDTCNKSLSPGRNIRQTTPVATATIPIGFVPVEYPLVPSLFPQTYTNTTTTSPAAGKYLPRNSMGAKVVHSPRNARGKPRSFFPVSFNPPPPPPLAAPPTAAALYPTTSLQGTFLAATPTTISHHFIEPKKSIEEIGYYDIPNIEMSPIQASPQAPPTHNTPPSNLKTLKSSLQILEEICTKNNWGNPLYSLHLISPTHDGHQLFQYKVYIPALGTTYIPSKYSRTVEEAQCVAADYTLIQLGYPLEATSFSPTRGIAGLSPLQPETTPLATPIPSHYSTHGYFALQNSPKHVPPPSAGPSLPPGWSLDGPSPASLYTGFDATPFHGPAHFPQPPVQELFHRTY